jgi:hypothetical protein
MLARDEDMDFEPVQVVSQPTSPQQQQDKSNDLSQSGVLVEALPTGVAVMMTDQEKEEISKRRIVKGTPPTPTTRSTSSTGLSSQAAAEAAAAKAKAAKDDIANAELLEEHHSHVATVISSVNDDELLLESLELDKQQRLKTLSREQKTKREKAIEERRKHPAGGVAGAVVHRRIRHRLLLPQVQARLRLRRIRNQRPNPIRFRDSSAPFRWNPNSPSTNEPTPKMKMMIPVKIFNWKRND